MCCFNGIIGNVALTNSQFQQIQGGTYEYKLGDDSINNLTNSTQTGRCNDMNSHQLVPGQECLFLYHDYANRLKCCTGSVKIEIDDRILLHKSKKYAIHKAKLKGVIPL